jgi:hypothetical protein
MPEICRLLKLKGLRALKHKELPFKDYPLKTKAYVDKAESIDLQ